MNYLPQAISIATHAGEILLSHFHSGFSHSIKIKSDHSPVTQADMASNKYITEQLIKLNSEIPVLSEENNIPDFSVRKKWERYWLIDPLDGTRGFINHSPEFCVNIALIENHEAALGVIYSPVEKICYYGVKNNGAFLIDANNTTQAITTSKNNLRPLRFLCGHTDRARQYKKALEKKFKNVVITPMNSALKFGLVACGKDDLYVRFGPTSEWDTAAGQCIVEAAGGSVVDFQGKPLQYNAKESLLNSSFMTMGDNAQCQRYLDLLQAISVS
ncbi:MAG: 3'(2'),5'-bisphosphate nucleotidase [Gammaproteobacteria bacterium RIFCSPHIGHO2_12_FULL_38_11]|nr:MAG: 3'(2'),5'-bisphosphate nucleotidase [Gammaproteobacteria bacterium RIFCSPHIGHO2_12_FULL_38_11]